MREFRPILMSGAAACVLLLAGCGSDGGLSVGAGSGSGTRSVGATGAETGTTGAGTSGDTASTGTNGNVTVASGSDGSTSGSSGTTAGGTGSTGGAGASGSDPLGNGAVMVTGSGTTVSTPRVRGLSDIANNTASPLLTTGNSLLPNGAVNSGVPVNGTVANTSLNGSTTQPLGVGVLSANAVPGTVASVNAASGGQTANVTVTPSGLTPTTDAATTAATNAVSPLTSTTSGVVGGSSALANATAANQNVVTGSNPLIGASALSNTQNQGSLATIGAAANGNTATAKLGSQTVLQTGR